MHGWADDDDQKRDGECQHSEDPEHGNGSVDAGDGVFTSGKNSWPLVIRIQVLVPVDNEQHHFLTQFLELATHNI